MSETTEQIALIEYCDWRANQDWRWGSIFHIPNQGKRTGFTHGQFIKMGLRPGMPDLMLPIPNSAYPGLFIEMKHGKGVLSPNQKERREILTRAGYLWVEARSFEQARSIIEGHLLLK
jgi:hypothetical protein